MHLSFGLGGLDDGESWCRTLAQRLGLTRTEFSGSDGTRASEDRLGFSSHYCYWYVWRVDPAHGEALVLSSEPEDRTGLLFTCFDTGATVRSGSDGTPLLRATDGSDPADLVRNSTIEADTWEFEFMSWVEQSYPQLTQYVELAEPDFHHCEVLRHTETDHRWSSWEARLPTPARKSWEAPLEAVYLEHDDAASFRSWLRGNIEELDRDRTLSVYAMLRHSSGVDQPYETALNQLRVRAVSVLP